MAKIEELKFELIDHPPHSPEFVPGDLFNFQIWKNGSVDNGSRQMRKLQHIETPVLENFQNLIFLKA